MDTLGPSVLVTVLLEGYFLLIVAVRVSRAQGDRGVAVGGEQTRPKWEELVDMLSLRFLK